MDKQLLTNEEYSDLEYMGENEKGEGFFHVSGELLEYIEERAIVSGGTHEQVFSEFMNEYIEHKQRFDI